ncbi:amidohydrolase [Frankia sp. CNm7]|uniref:Amidohydrolase n=2 Tax=Frankia nepalensis TaxID=1836974 RepID=A0A937USA0_9ACTN|nr:amidohydrolase [Frankia nepalensis]MBL7514245.1 amidohydrolase [Frankia nepalensis]MBL7524821.1 amidohydrolase [Frankia nepalensis]MBL7633644.1 amidohydrolase [Frankia nepalensis]
MSADAAADDVEPAESAPRARPAARPGGPGGTAARVADLAGFVRDWCARHEDELVAFRRDLHMHPELGRKEHRTAGRIAERLTAAGLVPRPLPDIPGMWCDIATGGPGDAARTSRIADLPDRLRRSGRNPVADPAGTPTDAPVVMLRADMDALPLQDAKDVPYASTIPGVCHACGHDIHTTTVLGAGLALAAYARVYPLPGTVRLVFQPAEETMPGGALEVIDAGVLKPVDAALTVHCDPALEVGTIGLRPGPITSAADLVEITLAGPGGHTSRPQNTVDLVYAMGALITQLPAALNRRIDPRSALALVWGQVQAGSVPNAIPRTGQLRGTVRTLSRETWETAPELIEQLAHQLVAPFGADILVDYRRGVPPVVNTADMVDVFDATVAAAFGHDAVATVAQSLGGEDFGWYLTHVPGALARLGTRTPGGPVYDLHQGDYAPDEGAIVVGTRLLAGAAVEALTRLAR